MIKLMQNYKNQIVYSYKADNGDFVTGTVYTDDDVKGMTLAEVEKDISSYLKREGIFVNRINDVMYVGATRDHVI